MKNGGIQRGFTMIEVLIGLAIFSVVSTSVYFGYASVIDIIQSGQYNSAAVSIIESRIEAVRNMRYEDVGLIGGIPAGTIPASSSVSLGTTTFELHSYIRNIDDPFDGTIASTPPDSTPDDYKLAQFEVTCATCTRYKVISMTTYIAPKNLENANKRGALFIHIQDARGFPVPSATVHITNSTVSPAVNFTDTTNTSGMLQLFGVATSSAGYHITVSKSGYSSEQTYSPLQVANPVHPDATVAAQQLTNVSLSIDHTGTLTVLSHDNVCAPVAGYDVRLTGSKAIGTAPTVPKYIADLSTNASGLITLSTVEWDTYTFAPIDTSLALLGAFSPLSVTIDPSESSALEFVTQPLSGSALSVAVSTNDGTPLGKADVKLEATGYSKQQPTGQTSLLLSDWSSGAYSDKSSELDTDSVPGTLTLVDHGGTYASASNFTLTSTTIDLGTASISLDALSWNPQSQPPAAGTDSLKFQLAANNDGATWNYVGPDGTASTYFTDASGGQALPASLQGNRYLRYQVTLRTTSSTVTPSLTSVTIAFRSGCVPSGSTLFNTLQSGTYTMTVTRAGYQTYSGSVQISSSWQQAAISLSPQ